MTMVIAPEKKAAPKKHSDAAPEAPAADPA